MRLVIGRLLRIVERYPPLVDGAFIIIAWVGIKLLIEYLHSRHYIGFEIPKWLSLGLIVVIFGAALSVRAACRSAEDQLATSVRPPSRCRQEDADATAAARADSGTSPPYVAARAADLRGGAVSVWWLSRYARRGAPADARRRRHGVLRAPTDSRGSGSTSSGTTCRSTDLAAICSTPSSRSRIGVSTTTRASTPSAWRARSFATCAPAGASRAGAR